MKRTRMDLSNRIYFDFEALSENSHITELSTRSSKVAAEVEMNDSLVQANQGSFQSCFCFYSEMSGPLPDPFYFLRVFMPAIAIYVFLYSTLICRIIVRAPGGGGRRKRYMPSKWGDRVSKKQFLQKYFIVLDSFRLLDETLRGEGVGVVA